MTLKCIVVSVSSAKSKRVLECISPVDEQQIHITRVLRLNTLKLEHN